MAMRKYVPNDRDREIVLRMAAIPGVKREDIAFCVTNERTNRPINRRTLEKHYEKELATGMAVMANIAMKSFVAQIEEKVWPATRLALSNYCGLKDNEVVANITAQNNNLNVTFIKPAYDSNGEVIPRAMNGSPPELPPPGAGYAEPWKPANGFSDPLERPTENAQPTYEPAPAKPQARTELDLPPHARVGFASSESRLWPTKPKSSWR